MYLVCFFEEPDFSSSSKILVNVGPVLILYCLSTTKAVHIFAEKNVLD
tara:strand:+ start:132 stop:275 length:144 start_codon:yes stop_codon:yes gene_type:complete